MSATKRKHDDQRSVLVKRQKSSTATYGQKGTKSSLKPGVTDPKRRSVIVNALSWRKVQLPDRLEDAEGFLDLEELDDVQVVTDENGLVSFHQVEVSAPAKVDDDHWAGFEDDEAPDISNETTKQKAMEPKPHRNGNDRSTTKPAQPAPRGLLDRQADRAKPDASEELGDVLGFDALQQLGLIQPVDVSAWRDLDLSDDVLSAISHLGFSVPTPIQQAAITPAIQGRDVIGKAVTGSGKTLAFGIPIVERFLKLPKADGFLNPPVALILAPTRELAHQLTKHLAKLCSNLERSPRIVTITGGLSVLKQQRQIETADVLICTPGRLWEVINSSTGLIGRLKQIRFLVIDEADRLLSDGHFGEVGEILDALDRVVIDEHQEGDDHEDDRSLANRHQRQTLVFSATFQQDLQQKLSAKQRSRPADSTQLSIGQSLDYLLKKLRFQRDSKPCFVDANPESSMAERLTEKVLECSATQKDLYLYSLLLWYQHRAVKRKPPVSALEANDRPPSRVLVFTNSISTVKRLVPLATSLAIPQTVTLPLHSGMPQKSRLRSLERFTDPPEKSTAMVVLVASDVAARGLDIKGIDVIVHYHVPRSADTYIHRSGRTARSVASGESILICSPEEVHGVTRLIAKVHNARSSPPSQAQAPSASIVPLLLPASLPTQLQHRVSLAQKITAAAIDSGRTKSESSWLATAAEELGVDYSSDEFASASSKMRRGRGGGREQKRRHNADEFGAGKAAKWKAELRDDLKGRRVDFGDDDRGLGGRSRKIRFLAGGEVDVEAVLRERDQEKARLGQ